jgi:hypothetical protein
VYRCKKRKDCPSRNTLILLPFKQRGQPEFVIWFIRIEGKLRFDIGEVPNAFGRSSVVS